MRFIQYLGAFCAIQAVASENHVNSVHAREQRGKEAAKLRAAKISVEEKRASQKAYEEKFAKLDKEGKIPDTVRMNGNGPIIRSPYSKNVGEGFLHGAGLELHPEESRKLLAKFDAENRELSEFHYRNNFAVATVYEEWDTTCLYPAHTFATLVNFCVSNQYGTSMMLKVNVQDDVFVILAWENGECGGTPAKVRDIFHRGALSFGNCGVYTYTGENIIINYETEHPYFDGLIDTFSEDYVCDQDLPYWYVGYSNKRCYNDGTNSWFYDTTECDAESRSGFYVQYYYTDTTLCKGDPEEMTWFETTTCDLNAFDDAYDGYQLMTDATKGTQCQPPLMMA